MIVSNWNKRTLLAILLSIISVKAELQVKCARGDRVLKQHDNGSWFSGVIQAVHSPFIADILNDDGNVGTVWQMQGGAEPAQVLKSNNDGGRLKWCWNVTDVADCIISSIETFKETPDLLRCTEFSHDWNDGGVGDGPLVMAHRGCCAKGAGFLFAPENTLASFAYAGSIGSRNFETDLRLTKDGEIVLLHDSTLDRTTNCTGPVANLTLAELRDNCDAGSWLDEAFEGERVPTLVEGLKLATSLNMTIILDLKLPGLGPKIAEDMERAHFNMADAIPSINFQSDNEDIVENLPFATIMVNQAGMMPGPNDPISSEYFNQLRGQGINIIFPHDSLLDKNGGAHFSNQFHMRGMQVWTWTVDTPGDWKKYINEGVGSICTNNPAGLITSLANHQVHEVATTAVE